MFKVFEMTDFCIRSSTPRALAPSSPGDEVGTEWPVKTLIGMVHKR